jgi:hypothetical protein
MYKRGGGQIAILIIMKSRSATVIASMLLAGFVQAAAQVPAPAPAPVAVPEPFVAVFSTTCMKYYNTGDKLIVAMKESGTVELTGDAARFFLNGNTGHAWTIPIEQQRYVVALRSDGICTVFAQHAQTDVIQKDFTRLVSRATPPTEARLLPGGPSGTAVHTITYAWAKPADDTQLVFTLTTSTNPAAPVQAMATVALTAK